jgi:hypothetical protein
MLSMPGWGTVQAVYPIATSPLIAKVRSALETVEIAFGPLNFSNQGFLCFSKRRKMKLFRLFTNLLHFHGFSLLFKTLENH